MNRKEHSEETQKEEVTPLACGGTADAFGRDRVLSNGAPSRGDEGSTPSTPAIPHIISLGAGVQSSTMALMAAVGEITPMPIAAIFADTQDEPKSVYKWLDWLEKQLPFPVHRVSAGQLSANALRIRISKKTGKSYTAAGVPWFLKNCNGTEGKVINRQCTRDYKVTPIHRLSKRIAGIKRGQKTIGLVEWIGISLDEIVRMKLSLYPYMEKRYPLIELKMSRHDCLRWMESKGYPKPPRSACVYCPFHSDAEWRRLKADEPEEFQRAVDFEQRVQALKAKATAFRDMPFLHRSLKPLSEVDFSTDIDRGQAAWWEENFRDECEGMCGV